MVPTTGMVHKVPCGVSTTAPHGSSLAGACAWAVNVKATRAPMAAARRQPAMNEVELRMLTDKKV